ncbi:MAG: hypothetical protein QOI61_186 [Actinomycetota bacterium]|jgi:LPXTG-motif cell wall-anchored protein
MSAVHLTTGSFAAAVLGTGTAAATEAPKSVRGTAVQVGHELAQTGVDFTVMLVVLATILLIGGLLLVSLARRHAPTVIAPPGLDPGYLT